MYNFCLILKIFTGCIEWAFRHLHIKYLRDQRILKYSHKLAYNYKYTHILQVDSKWITMINK